VTADGLDFGWSEADLAWLAEVKEFVARYVQAGLPEERAAREQSYSAAGYSELERSYYGDLAARGWNALHWPEEFGGSGRPALHSMLLSAELEYARLPQIEWTVSTIAPVIMRFGTERNKADWLEGIRTGAVTCALGFSEPNAGSDLAALSTRAVRDGDHFVVNGQKIWNSGAHFASHEWLAVRTDPAQPKHRGISVLIVPLDAPGIEITPLWTWSGSRTNLTFFSDVRVPVTNLIGEENRGWQYIVSALDFERAAIGGRVIGAMRRLLDDVIGHCAAARIDGEALAGREDVRVRLAELETQVDVVTLLAYDICSVIDAGETPTIPGTMQKVMASELRTTLTDCAMELMDLYGQLDHADPWAPANGEIEHQSRYAAVQRFGGGANEIMRDVIAQRGLGLPRSRD
jgi:3-oxocholest-4-en-26-oyl-CoA dehydrogenase alpha subunit